MASQFVQNVAAGVVRFFGGFLAFGLTGAVVGAILGAIVGKTQGALGGALFLGCVAAVSGGIANAAGRIISPGLWLRNFAIGAIGFGFCGTVMGAIIGALSEKPDGAFWGAWVLGGFAAIVGGIKYAEEPWRW